MIALSPPSPAPSVLNSSLFEAGHFPLPWPTRPTSSISRKDSPFTSPKDNSLLRERKLSHSSVQLHAKPSDEAQPASEFVRKLYKMLEDSSLSDVVSWSPEGDYFLVKDTNVFTKNVLPRMFKHSNFASFVRQLNKYDFHKVRNFDDDQLGDQIWAFRHPEFRAHRRDTLENIKRKVSTRKGSAPSSLDSADVVTVLESPSSPSIASDDLVQVLQVQVRRLTQSHEQMSESLRSLEEDYRKVLSDMLNVQQTVTRQDELMRTLILSFLQSQNDKKPEHLTTSGPSRDPTGKGERTETSGVEEKKDDASSIFMIPQMSPEFLTFGQLMPKANNHAPDADSLWSSEVRDLVLPSPFTSPPSSCDTAGSAPSSSSTSVGDSPFPFNESAGSDKSAKACVPSQTMRVRRSTFVPAWAVPPRILLVDDDAVSRQLSSKFLQVSGCAIDVAVDGVSAVNKMNVEKYDLVLMDIVMPEMDGLSATSLIRQFDASTPIISMTSNSEPREVWKYFSGGMNDILPKPFTNQGLFEILEKHLIHLKSIQQMLEVPRYPTPSINMFDQKLSSFAIQSPLQGESSRDGTGTSFSEEQYTSFIQNFIGGSPFLATEATFGANSPARKLKRALEDNESSDSRCEKRGRFEAIE